MTRDTEELKRIIAGTLETEGRTEAEIAVFQKKAAKMMHELGRGVGQGCRTLPGPA